MPDRIRVHALAKLLGVKSKQLLGALEELGVTARSPHSSVSREAAESVRDAIAKAAESGSVEPEPAAPEHAEPEHAAPEPELATAVVSETVVVETAAEDTAAAPADTETPAREEPAAPEVADPFGAQQQLFASPGQQAVEDANRPAFEPNAVVPAPLFLQPDAGVVEETRRRRRTESQSKAAAPAESAPQEKPAPTEAPAEAKTTGDESADKSADETGTDETSGDSATPRRRRRGRRGRGRGRGEQPGGESENDSDDDTDEDSEDETSAESSDESNDSADSGDSSDSGDADDSDEDDESATGDGPSRRRRRRRRRKVGSEATGDATATSEDDPPNTVVHEREPRNKPRVKDEVQGITGSTRLEAKRQRRRDGRDAGRRRPPILTESEFLARREAVDRVMVVREKNFPDQGATTQVAVLEDNVLVEHFVTSTSSGSMVGNIYLGRVQNVLPSMEAAFVDIGRGRNGVLYAGEVNWEAAGLGGNSRKIEQALKPGDQVLVQVSKDPVGHKGARLTTQISLAGRFLVYVPGGSSTGISRKLPDTERKRLKEILRDIVPADAGVIIRTASEGVSEEELARDVERLQNQWRKVDEEATAAGGKGNPKTLYEEPDLLVKVIRDLFNEDFSKIVIEGEKAWTTVESYIRTVAPDLLPRVHRHEGNGGPDVFEAHRIDEQLAKALERKVWLPSGGTLVIDRTEAMTVVDVNTGKFTGAGGNLEETVTRNNLEAAEEIVRQMRLRDIGGMIVVDFIDMVLESNRDLVLRRLTEALGRDRTRHQVSEVTSLGLVQMTRKKLGTGLVEAFSTPCEHCHGRGILVHAYPVEVSSGDDSGSRQAARSESPARKRRGRERPAPEPAEAVSNGHPASEVDASVRRAHPVALAMAAHHHDHPAAEHASESEQVVADQPAEVAADLDAAATEVTSDVLAPEVDVEVTPTVPETAKPDESTAAAEPVAEDKPAEKAAEEPVSAPAAPESAEPERRGWLRRKVSRAAAAPEGAANAGKVFVIPATPPAEAPESKETATQANEPEQPVPVRQPRPRRAAGRPAGPPVDVDA
ncbi:translation initiation factor IF-2 N-terminal domain-containing protein [Antrihabitans sp. YC2-6]|uniref:translation initiation factor IF-2 N-terminal domain-containing protein n=1 Tax=Antrihabitans sp. YC2-6 TaxID=2799498 RepID=UPI0018F5512B|nr:translation initiation factor IF-2 N-terminal domain-containing protein [Antrihabitans sp. YC2-6]MBJ8346801.1 translation initiation factor IF-2 N-terminal domain-containing protein [Antrihabitans sp. YC2-6]